VQGRISALGGDLTGLKDPLKAVLVDHAGKSRITDLRAPSSETKFLCEISLIDVLILFLKTISASYVPAAGSQQVALFLPAHLPTH
jgi:hypothetical protein